MGGDIARRLCLRALTISDFNMPDIFRAREVHPMLTWLQPPLSHN